MKNIWLRPVLILVPIILMAVALASGQVTHQPPTRALDGAGIFHNYCAACHGPDAQGNGPAAKDLKHQVPDLTRLSQRNGGTFPALHVRTTIMFGSDELVPAHGSKLMPVWGPTFHDIDFDQDLGQVRLDNLTKYLESIQKK
jgi:mono/diheme cytochrome c family protein